MSVNAKRTAIAVLCMIAGYFGSQIPKNLTITKTDSVKHRVFWSVKPDDRTLEKGQYIRAMVRLNLPKYKCDPCSIVKRIACKAGDRLEEKAGVFECNGQAICKVREGKEPFQFNGIIPNGSVFAIGDSPDSYDSRYFGFIDMGDIDAFLIPLI